MTPDPDQGLVTDQMIGLWFVIAADITALTGFAWIGGYVSLSLFVAVSLVTNGAFAAWIAWRWYAIRQADATDRSAVEELKHQYAAGDLSETEFERRLDTLIDADESGDGTDDPTATDTSPEIETDAPETDPARE